MWCAQCQLDAPALAVPEEPGVLRCAFCHSVVTGIPGRPEPRPVAAKPVTAPLPIVSPLATDVTNAASAEDEAELPPREPPRLVLVPPPVSDDWRADAELRAVERTLKVLRQSYGDVPAAAPAWSTPPPPSAEGAPAAVSRSEPAAEKSSLAAWCSLTLGLMAFACGGVLIVWSFAADRGDLWSLGLPLTLAGQAGLVLGLLLQLDGLWQTSRRTEATLSDLDGQLGELRNITALVSSTHSGPAHAFYSHLSQGASPQILLADLKGQLDLLAQQMARHKKAA